MLLTPKLAVLIMGDRGTGKSTTIRALADLLQISPLLK
jgi:Mg-chelatase subunit ChlI